MIYDDDALFLKTLLEDEDQDGPEHWYRKAELNEAEFARFQALREQAKELNDQADQIIRQGRVRYKRACDQLLGLPAPDHDE